LALAHDDGHGVDPPPPAKCLEEQLHKDLEDWEHMHIAEAPRSTVQHFLGRTVSLKKGVWEKQREHLALLPERRGTFQSMKRQLFGLRPYWGL